MIESFKTKSGLVKKKWLDKGFDERHATLWLSVREGGYQVSGTAHGKQVFELFEDLKEARKFAKSSVRGQRCAP
jgi:hypothetical protein